MRVDTLLDERISILTFTENKDADTGFVSVGFSGWLNVWASQNDVSGGEKEENKIQVVGSGLTEFVVRWRSGISQQMRILFDNQVYNIKRIHRIGRKKYIKIVAEQTDRLNEISDSDISLISIDEGNKTMSINFTDATYLMKFVEHHGGEFVSIETKKKVN
ncbi:MAG: head-tail adaptor protein [Flavobacteriaceae bacterium]